MRKKIVSIDISEISYANALAEIAQLAKKHTHAYACFSNVHMVIEAYHSKEFQKMVNDATYAFADGMPLVFAMRLLYSVHQERIAGMDFMADVLKASNLDNLSIFLFGSTDAILNSLEQFIIRQYPNVRTVGKISPPFRKLSVQENQDYVNQINSSGANIVLVGLGCPKQETWMAQHSPQINAVLLGVGGAFELHAGKTTRAPLWMRNFGLEWLYRLAQEPRRLFARYAKTNSLFIWLLIKQLFSKR